jgi:hypothetical protein
VPRLAEINLTKYVLYLLFALITSGAFWWISGSLANALAIMLLLLFAVTVELVCDLRGYFGAVTARPKIGLVRKAIGYLIGTFIFVVLGLALLRLMRYVLKLVGISV